ncbi:MAG: SPFH domain-containing protein [Chloroflexi bacterium]|nr:SPFH domain-containing protein [Chloroflexota bacterium]
MSESAPPLFRFLLWIGGPFGLYYVPENHVRLVRRMEQYHRLERGPGFKRYNTLTETLGPQFKVGLEAFSFQFDNLPTNDGLQVGLRFALNYEFAPEKIAKLTTIAKLGGLSRDVFCEIVANRVRRALLNILPAYAAEVVCRAQEFENIEKQLVANTNKLLEPLGIAISSPLILQVTPPDSLRARFEGVAQRRIQVEAMREYQSTEMSRALAAELIEGVAGRGTGDQYVNPSALLSVAGQAVGDALDTYNQPDPNASPTLPADPERKSFLKPNKK